jgi:hypothetical protein
MADIIATGTSGYATGSIDTATTLVNNVSPTDAKHPNGCAAAAIQIEQILGSGTTLKGTAADLGARLAVATESTGKLILNVDAGITGPLNVTKGGTGLSTITLNKLLLGNTTSAFLEGSGLVYQGPTSTGTGSTAAHEGVITISGNQNYSGIHFCTDFTLNNTITATIIDGSGRLVIFATGTITINGIIDGIGGGSTGGPATTVVNGAGPVGGHGFTHSAGGGGGGEAGAATGGIGGSALIHGILRVIGGAGGAPTFNGTAGTTRVADLISIADALSIMGGAGGGAGGGDTGGTASGVGGNGGASIVLVAPTIVLASTATLNTSGANGGSPGGGAVGGGGGGSAGNIYIICRSFTDNGATITQSAGTGGTGPNAGGNGGNGVAGVKEIMIYA